MSTASIARPSRHRWVMLAVSMSGQAAATVYVHTAPFLIPYLHLTQGIDLVQAGLLASAPLVGVALTLAVWGWAADLLGEKRAMAMGLAILVVGALGAAFTDSFWWCGAFLLAGGMGGASANSASGRVVAGWFPPDGRGLAMGIRQAGQPLGVGIAALLVPNVAVLYGLRAAMLVPAVICALALVLVMVTLVDPPRPSRAEAASQGQLDNPYRGDRRLLRIHASSVLLVIPQTTIWTFALVWLIDEQGLSTAVASTIVAGTQVLGALARVASGWWSDRVGSRLRPMRQVAIAAMLVMVALGVLENTPLAIAILVVAAAVTVADNGLAFTAVAEAGGPYWSGRTIGVQNTGQYLAGAAVPPAVAGLVLTAGYGLTFGLISMFPLAAIFLIPVEAASAGRSLQTRFWKRSGNPFT